MPHMYIYAHHHRESWINQSMDGWLVRSFRASVGWRLDSWVRVSGGFAPLAATNIVRSQAPARAYTDPGAHFLYLR